MSTFCWRQAVPSDNIAHGNEAKSFVEVQFSRYAVVVELRQYVAMSLHLSHAGSSATEYSEACQEASRLISKARTHSLKPVFLGMDSNVEFAWTSDTIIGEHSLERLMPLMELASDCGGKEDTTFWGPGEFVRLACSLREGLVERTHISRTLMRDMPNLSWMVTTGPMGLALFFWERMDASPVVP